MYCKMNWIKILFVFIILVSKSISIITDKNTEFRDTAHPIWQRLLEYNPKIMREIFGRLEKIQLQELKNFSAKRGLDLGLNRGISGTQAGKHLIGLTTAHFADGPGRRRRSQ